MIITLSVSLSGDFTDVYSSLPYRYYPQAEIHRIVPTHGPKDGDTLVQAWGKNFLDLGDDLDATSVLGVPKLMLHTQLTFTADQPFPIS